MPDTNRRIEVDLDKEQPVKPMAVEGPWGVYEQLAKAKQENPGQSLPIELGVARPEGSNELTSLRGRLRGFDDENKFVGGDNWFNFSSNSSGAGIATSVEMNGEILTEMKGGSDFYNLDRAAKQLLNRLDNGETGTIALQPEYLRIENSNHEFQPVDSNGDLSLGIPILRVTKTGEKLQNPNDTNVRFATAWQASGTNELTLDATPLNGVEFAKKLNALISTDANLGPFTWSNISLQPNQAARERGVHQHIHLDLKDIDNPDEAGRWVSNQAIGASNQPEEGSDLYTYEYSQAHTWTFKEIYASLKEGDSASFILDRIHVNTGDQWTDISTSSNRIDNPLMLTITETNPDPKISSLNLKDLSFKINSEISLDQIFNEGGKLNKSFIDAKIDSSQQSASFWTNYKATINGQDYWFHGSAREEEWNGKKLTEDFNLPWNSLDFIKAAVNSKSEELTLTREWASMHVQSDTTQERYWSNLERDGRRNQTHELPRDWAGLPIIAADSSTILNPPDKITLSLGDLEELANKFNDTIRPDYVRFGNYELSNKLLSLENAMVNDLTGKEVDQIAVLGRESNRSSDYRLDITAESLSKIHNLEGLEIQIQFDPLLFESLNASDVRISSLLPVQNSITIDNVAGTVTLSGASLASLAQGSMINKEAPLASIDLSFDNDYLKTIAFDQNTGKLAISPITFQMNVGENEVIFSRNFTDETGQRDRSIQSLAELGGDVALSSSKISLIREIVRMEEEEGQGLTLGTQRTIGVKNEFTNLVRHGSTLEANTHWRNTGNTTIDGLRVDAVHNENARLVNASIDPGKGTLESGRFVNGEWRAESAESTEISAKIQITGEAGKVVDLSEGILSVATDTSDQIFKNKQGSKNLITYQGDLNYDGRVSFKDLAYLNAGAARQVLVDKVDKDGITTRNQFGTVEKIATDKSLARDVDANYDGKISIADLSVLEKDWGKTLHTGNEAFLGSGEKLNWNNIDGNGTWDNSSFKRENAISADALASNSANTVQIEPVIHGSGVTETTTTPNDKNDLFGTAT